MKDSIYVALFLLVIASIFAIISMSKKAGKHTFVKGDYDERQNRIRGAGYKISFFAYMIEFALLWFIDGEELHLPVTNGALYALMFIVPVGIFVVYCIKKDAFIGVRNNIKRFVAVAIAAIIVNGASAIVQYKGGAMIVDGKLTSACISPAMGLLFLVVLIALLVRNSQLKAQAVMEDEES